LIKLRAISRRNGKGVFPVAKSAKLIAGIPQDRLTRIATREARRFAQSRPKAAAALAKGAGAFPMHWMADWPMPHLPLVAKATGAEMTDIDGYGIDDFCLGDTGSMFGHSPAPVARPSANRPGAASPTCCRPRRAGSRSPADRPLRPLPLADRHHRHRCQPLCPPRCPRDHRRPKVLVFNGCYHGTVDDTIVELAKGKTVNPRASSGRSTT
jgi:glutamate-1-semialdehyde 2,1-aminomutase